MKTFLICIVAIIFTSCAQLEQTAKQASVQTQSAVISKTVRKVQNVVENKIDETIDNIGNKKKKEPEAQTVSK